LISPSIELQPNRERRPSIDAALTTAGSACEFRLRAWASAFQIARSISLALSPMLRGREGHRGTVGRHKFVSEPCRECLPISESDHWVIIGRISKS
jgi:hypothetical protein